MTDWNPNAGDNCVVGLEWAPIREVNRPVTGQGVSSYSWGMEATDTETITKLYTYSDRYVASATDVIDIYNESDLEPVRPQIDSFAPTGDAVSGRFILPTGGRWYSSPSRTENVNQSRMTAASDSWYNLIDDDPFVPGAYVGVVSTNPQAFTDPAPLVNRQFVGLVAAQRTSTDPSYTSSRSRWAFQFNGLTTNTSGRRILGLRLSCLAQRLVDARDRASEFDQPYEMRPLLRIGAATVFGQLEVLPSTPTELSYTWLRNPLTGKAWTETDLDAFSNAVATSSAAWQMYRPPGNPDVWSNTAGAFYRCRVEVIHCEETRVAEAVRVSSSQNVGWNRWNVTEIGSSSGWSKTTGERYLLNQRLIRNEDVIYRPQLSSEGLSTRALGSGPRQPETLFETQPTFIGSVPRNMGDATDYVPAVVLATSTGLSLDSNPYAVVNDSREFGVVRTPGQNVLEQEVAFATSDGPNVIRVWARSENDQRPHNDLTVYCQAAVGGSVFAAELITPDMLDRPSVWQEFQLEVSSPDLSGFTPPFTVTFEATTAFGAQPGIGWQVLVATDGTLEPGAAAPDGIMPADIGYGYGNLSAAGGDPYEARVDGTVIVNPGRRPDTPANFATPYYDENDQYGPCWVLSWDGVGAWEPTPPCSTVIAYEIERQVWNPVVNDFEPTWQQVYRYETEGTAESYTARDYEAPRNTPVNYRLRLQASTGFYSIWQQSGALEPEPDTRCGYWLTSNQAPQLNTWIDDLGQRSYNFVEQVDYYRFEGRDGSVPTRGLTDGLDRFTIDAFVAGRNASAPTPDSAQLDYVGRWLFDRLTVFTGNKRNRDSGLLYRLPYICVKDQDGRRWLSSVETPSGVRREAAGQYRIELNIVEITRNPDGTVYDESRIAEVEPAEIAS